jgi:hypothetical protein
MRYTVPAGSAGVCGSIKMKSDGKVFFANRQGSIDVPDHYASEIKRSAQFKREYVSPGIAVGADMHNGAGKICVKCAFHAFQFSKSCPKCGNAEFKAEE